MLDNNYKNDFSENIELNNLYLSINFKENLSIETVIDAFSQLNKCNLYNLGELNQANILAEKIWKLKPYQNPLIQLVDKINLLRKQTLVNEPSKIEKLNQLYDQFKSQSNHLMEMYNIAECKKFVQEHQEYKELIKVPKNIKDYNIKDEKARIEIAKLVAQRDGNAVSSLIEDYNIKDEKALVEIAKLAINQKNGWGVSAYIQNYNIKDEKARIEIAKLAAGQNGLTSYYIQNYNIKDEKALVEIAKLAADQNGLAVSKKIQNYHIKDEKARVEIAKFAAGQNALAVFKNIQNYDIKDEQARVEIVKLAADQDGEAVSLYIQNYNIGDEKVRIEIAKRAAVQNGRAVSKYIQNYDIKDEKARIEIAKLAADQDGEAVSLYIQNYHIKDEKARVEIAKFAAGQNALAVFKNIQNYDIKDEQARIEIAKLAADQDGEAVSLYIQNYDIKDEKARIEIAKRAVVQNGRAVSQYIQNYNIEDEKVRIEIVKLVVVQDGFTISEHIQNYDIKDEQVRIEIARFVASQNGFAVSEHIQNYNIKDEKVRVEIAKLVASQSGFAVSEHIQNYDIKDEQARIEIAKLAVDQNGRAVSEHIKNYDIKNEKARIEIAKLAVDQEESNISLYIQNYDIKDEKVRIEIAKFVVVRDGRGVSSNIQNYDIKDEQARVELAKLAANQDGDAICWLIQRYKIKDEKTRVEIAKRVAVQYGNVVSYCLPNYDIKDEKVRIEILERCLLDYKNFNGVISHISAFTKDPYLINLKNINSLKEFLELVKKPGPFSLIVEKITEENFLISKSWLISALIMIHIHPNFSPDPLLWQSLFKYNDLKIRQELTQRAAFQTKGELDFYNTVVSQGNEHIRLPALFLNGKEFGRIISAIDKNRDFKDGSFMKCLLDTLSLFFDTNLSNEEIASLLDKVIQIRSKEAMRSTFLLIQGILSCGGVKELKQASLESNKIKFLASLNEIQEKIFTQALPVQIPNFTVSYMETFGKRQEVSSALMVYIGRLHRLPKLEKEKALSSLAFYVKTVLSFSFEKERYNKEASPHLKLIFEKRPELEKAWAQNERIEISEKESVKIDMEAFLKKTILQDKFLDSEKFPFIEKYLSSTTEEEKNKVFKGLIEKSKITKDKGQLPALQLQKQLIELIKAKDKVQKLNLLNQIASKLKTFPTADTFLKNIQDFIEALDQKTTGLIIVNTDDFAELLLCGNVQGSCQAVDGDPKNSKCLLSYLLDGKNRLVAIKDENGRIVARSILRLLWDANKKVPALMQEYVYPDKVSEEIQELLNEHIESHAKKLHLSLFRPGQKNFQITSRLQSKGGRAPWEYVDSSGGVNEDSIYEITSAREVKV